MKQKRIFALTLVLTLLIGMLAIIPTASASPNGPVNLIYAKPAYTSSGTGAMGYVEVENIAYEKKVTIHYSFDGIDWQDCAASYYKPTWGNYEAWKFETPGKTPVYRDTVTVRFAIKYEVNGQTYWDNNNGNDYYVSNGYFVGTNYDFGVGGIADGSAYKSSSSSDTVYGSLQLKNLGEPKTVKVIYTTDNWATTKEADAHFGGTSSTNPSVEKWYYNYQENSNNIQYKLSYTVNGTTYVDDNFGEFYTVTVY